MTAIRPETADDRAAIVAVHRAAFAGRVEADLVNRLRAEGALIVSLVAEVDGRVIGNIAFSRLRIRDSVGEHAAVSLAPVGVLPGFQRRGIGRALIEGGHELLRKRGESLSFVVGEPAYYGRFGYVHDRAAGFVSGFQGEHFMARAFGAAPGDGTVVYPVAFAELA